jgi:hypothetical protein
MRFRDWIHPPRHVLAVFVAVACLSAGVLVWLAWLLLEQDKTVEIQRRQERVEQAADRATAVMQLSLTDLQSQLQLHPARAEAPPRGISIVSAGRSGITVRPEGGLLYYPVAALNSEAPPQAFAEGERLEFARRDLRGAARFYSRAAADGNAALRAGALTRLARVRRKLHEPEAALQAYTQLAEVRRVSVHGIPAGLISREGRASVLEEVTGLRNSGRRLLRCKTTCAAGAGNSSNPNISFTPRRAAHGSAQLRWMIQMRSCVRRASYGCGTTGHPGTLYRPD